MRNQIKLLLNLLTICFLCSAVLAQQSSAEQAAAHRQAALNSLEQLRASVSEITNECLRLRAQLQMADLLWARDEAQARQMFEEAFKLAFKSPTESEKETCPAQSRKGLGFEVLKLVARRDPEWAVQLIDALPDSLSTNKLAVSLATQQRDLKASLYQYLAISVEGSTSEQAKRALNSITDKIGEVESATLIRLALPGEEALSGQKSVDASTEIAPLNLLGALSDAASPNFAAPQINATQALLSGDFDQAMSLIEKIGDPQTRLQFGALARFSAVSAAISAGNFDEAMQHAQAVPGLSERAATFVNLAQAVGNKKGAVRAAEIMRMAKQSLESEQESAEKAQALLTLAEAMIELEPERGFELTQLAIETLNSMDRKQAATSSEASLEETNLGQVLTKLLRYDFARAWNLASSINNRGRAWFTNLALCKAALNAETGMKKAAQF